jgi:hypothetical protein
MKRVCMVLCFIGVLALPTGMFGASDAYAGPSGPAQARGDKDKATEKDKEKDVKDKSVPAPPVLVLLGAAAAVAGAGKFWFNRGRI